MSPHQATLLPLLLILLVPLARAEERAVDLSSLDLSDMRQGWGTAQIDRSVIGRPLAVGGERFEHGLGSHAPGVILLQLGGQCIRFTAQVGVDDETGGRGSVTFTAIGDGRTLFRSGLMRGGDPPQSIAVDLTGVSELALLMGDGGDGKDFDHADWGEVQLHIKGWAPTSIPLPREEKVILTPAPSPKPRINGAKVLGVRPGSPVLFRVAATGERPLTYAAADLPAGLTLDLRTGLITGTIDDRRPRTHVVKLEVRNSLGAAQRELRIVVGDTLALTPPMGWNSWYVLENRVTDLDIRAAADAMVASGLIDHGYTYVSIDDCWANSSNATDPLRRGPLRDEHGNITGNSYFPDMKALTDYIHSKGLKAGIYTSPGPLTCAGYAGSYEHEAQDAQRFAEWGFDFLKYDWCSYHDIAKNDNREELMKPYRLMHSHLKQQDRDIVFNLCQYGMGQVWEWGKDVGGNCWRTTGDLGASFHDIPAAMQRIGFGQNGLEKWAGPGHWNDPDYLLIGEISNWHGGTARSPLSPNEQYTHVTLWCLLAAPLFLSGDITRLDPFTLSLLTNDEVIEVDQDPLGEQARRVAQVDDLEVWAKAMEDGSKAVGLFNRSEVVQEVTALWSDLGITGRQCVRDLWRQQDLGLFADKFQARVDRHGAVLVRLQAAE
ncbi:MAG: NPCBM/NEW2 domain-containing protein [Planctomycetota bacterium]